MRTTDEFRKRQIDMLPLALQRPGMFCGSGEKADLYYSMILSDLCWLDERETAWKTIGRELLHGAMRVYGQFFYQHLAIPDGFLNEIASTYAQVAYRLGYYHPERVLTECEFQELNDGIDAAFFTVDHTEGEIVSRFGRPTHDVLGGLTTVHCYGCFDRGINWVYFDYARCYPPRDSHSCEWFADPCLRNVRRTSNRMELLPFAAWCRNGRDAEGSS